ncbi:MAG: anti-sigma factor [Anaerolineae bacterium]
MDCRETRTLLHGYIDDELDLVSNLKVEEHLHTCADCTGRVDAQQALRARLGDDSLYFRAPAHLRQSVRASVKRAGRGSTLSRWQWWPWVSLAATLAALVLVVWWVGPEWQARQMENNLADEVTAGHVRSLMVNHLADIPSSDQHTVKPWFDGKLDFAPPVVDLAGQGFPLTGGRLDYINGRAVAALIYYRQRHPINLFIWPTADGSSAGMSVTERQGYNLVHWTGHGMTYWAVSDLNTTELQQFAALLQQQGLGP